MRVTLSAGVAPQDRGDLLPERTEDVALTDGLGGKVRSAMRRAPRRPARRRLRPLQRRRDGGHRPLRHRAGQRPPRPRRRPPRPHPQRHAQRRPATRWPTASRSPTSSTYAPSVPSRSPATTRPSSRSASRRSCRAALDALYNALTDATLREALGTIEADVLVTDTRSCWPWSPSSRPLTSRWCTRSTGPRRAGSTTSARCCSSPRGPTSSCR